MKTIFLLFAMISTLACSRQIDPDPIGPPPGDPSGPTLPPRGGGGGGGAVEVYSCTTHDVPYPTQYTVTIVENMPPGFGFYIDSSYDKGWKQGYQDAVFYHNYYQIDIPSGNYCLLTMKHGIHDVSVPGAIRYESSSYKLKAGETSMGIFIQSGACQTNWLTKKCVLKNAIESKSLRLQYEFNYYYTGPRTPEQESFDKGRYDGFMRGISQEPFQN